VVTGREHVRQGEQRLAADLLRRQERGDGPADWREVEIGGDRRLVRPLVQEFFDAEEGAYESRVHRAAEKFLGDGGAVRR
jgi:hypothetical protein